MAEKLRISFTVPDADRFEAVLKAAADLGFIQDAAFPRLGVATGTIAPTALDDLRSLKGVGAVELQKAFRAV